ncbi:MAG TPA: hypothetical protein VGK94_13445 [Candidatus Polarisedimenticolia bacterium]
MKDPTVCGYLLWFLLGLFCLRVLGQLLVVLRRPRWLPPMEQWYSGVIPYRILLPIQLVFILVMGLIAHSFTGEHLLVPAPGPGFARGIVWFSYLYAALMLLRYAVRMIRRVDQKWFGGTIPIIFHLVLAAFLYVFGTFHVI